MLVCVVLNYDDIFSAVTFVDIAADIQYHQL